MEEQANRVAALERLITAYQASYYGGEAEIGDAEFDALWDELERLAPESPVLRRIGKEADGDGFPKARHLIPMGSQDKVRTAAEFLEWAQKRELTSFIVQHKLDGASLELQYEGGHLVKAVTRGDGVTGDEITANARKMRGVRADVGGAFSGGVRGEVVMLREVWRAKYADKANCRNAANGLMRRKDGAGCEDLSFIAYDAGGLFETETDKTAWLRACGFTVVDTRRLDSAEALAAYRDEAAGSRAALPYDIDGLVVKDERVDLDDLRKNRPERQVAFKFAPEEAVSILRAVEWSESGATYTPVGIVDPVRLAGTTVKRANLNNPESIRALGLKTGLPVIIVKRGEIIPKIERLAPGAEAYAADARDIPLPTTCGFCGTALVDEGTRLLCPNESCGKRILHRLLKWASVLDIRELGEKLVTRLFETGRVRAVSDLYTLEEAELAECERMGRLSAAKVLRHLKAPRALPLPRFVAGFDIEGVGELIMEKARAAGFDTLEKLRNAEEAELAAIHGLAETTARTIRRGLAETARDMDATLASGVISIAEAAEALPLSGISFCITGELASMKRNEARAKLEARGGSLRSAVVKDLSYLVTNNPESGSSKNKKARELGIPIIGEEAFLQMLEG